MLRTTLLLVSLLALAACSDSSPAPAPAPAAPTPARTPAAAPAAAPARDTPPPAAITPRLVGPLTVDPGGLNFGVVAPHSTHKGSFTLTNTGTHPITIVSAKPSCLCTAPENLAGKTIAPGASLPFSTSYNAPAEPGEKSAKIFLVFDYAGDRENAIIPLDAQIVMAVKADPPYVDALKVTQGQLRVASGDGQPFRIVSCAGAAPAYADGFDPSKDAPRSSYTVRWEVEGRAEDDCKGMRLWWPIETDHPECPVLPVRVRHACTGARADPGRNKRGWFFDEYIAVLGAVKAGQPAEATVTLVNPGAVRITSARSLSPDGAAELLSAEQEPDGKTVCRVRFTPRPGRSGLLYAMVELVSDTGAMETAFIGRVE